MVRNSGNPRINRLRRFLFIFAMVVLSTNVRYGRGLILNLEGKVKKKSGHRYEVNGYDVTYKNGHWQCSCPDHKHRRGPCKHIYATGQVKAPIRFMAGLAAYLGRPGLCCRKCLSPDVVKNGNRTLKDGTKRQTYRCRCGHRFVWRPGFEKKRFDTKTIVDALHEHAQGASFRKISENLARKGISVNPSTVYRWVSHYGRSMDAYMNTITPRVGEQWHADEVMLTIGGVDMYLMSMIDGMTRFWLSFDMALSKNTADARILFRNAMSLAGKIPSILVTDKLAAYARAYLDEYAAKNDFHKQCYHIFEIHIRNQRQNNNKMERFNGTIKERYRAWRALKKKDSPCLLLFRTYYNHARRHQSLNDRTPGEAAGIIIEGPDKMLTIIENMACSA